MRPARIGRIALKYSSINRPVKSGSTQQAIDLHEFSQWTRPCSFRNSHRRRSLVGRLVVTATSPRNAVEEGNNLQSIS